MDINTIVCSYLYRVFYGCKHTNQLGRASLQSALSCFRGNRGLHLSCWHHSFHWHCYDGLRQRLFQATYFWGNSARLLDQCVTKNHYQLLRTRNGIKWGIFWPWNSKQKVKEAFPFWSFWVLSHLMWLLPTFLWNWETSTMNLCQYYNKDSEVWDSY